MRFDLSDEEWATIKPYLPKGGRGPKRVDDRRVLNGIFYILRTGVPWRDLPERYGPRTTVYNRYVRWARRGVWKSIFDALVSQNEDSLFFIDSSIVKAHRAATGAKGGNWRRVSAAHTIWATIRGLSGGLWGGLTFLYLPYIGWDGDGWISVEEWINKQSLIFYVWWSIEALDSFFGVTGIKERTYKNWF